MSFVLSTQKLLQLLMRHADIRGSQTVKRLYSCEKKKKKCVKKTKCTKPPGNKKCPQPPPTCKPKEDCKIDPCDPMDRCRIKKLREAKAKEEAANKRRYQVK